MLNQALLAAEPDEEDDDTVDDGLQALQELRPSAQRLRQSLLLDDTVLFLQAGHHSTLRLTPRRSLSSLAPAASSTSPADSTTHSTHRSDESSLLGTEPADRAVRSRQCQPLWVLVLCPMLIFGSLGLFLLLAPGTVGRGSALVYDNPALIAFASLAQIVLAAYLFVAVLLLLRQTHWVRVNTVLPITEADERALATFALQLSAIFAILIVLYIGVFWRPVSTSNESYSVPMAPAIGQLIFVLVFLSAVCCPWLAAWPQRKAFTRLLWRALFLQHIGFEEVLLADVLTSTPNLLYGLVFAGCNFIYSDYSVAVMEQDSEKHKVHHPCQGTRSRFAIWFQPLLFSLPFAVRLAQCLLLYFRTRRAGAVGWAVNQHLTNASKYFTSIVSVFAVASVKLDNHYNHNNNQMCFRDWHVLIVLVLLLRSAFNFAWDVKMDWALGHWHNVRWPLLRPIMLMKPPSLYYLALVLNALGRISWIATLESSWCYAGCALLFAFIEIGRRFMWLAFRLEHQVLKFAETHHATTNKYIVPHLAG